MYMKVFPHGKGAGSGPVNYLIRMDYPGRDEEPPAVLRGDPDTTRELIDSQDRTWKFTAGVLSWAPGEEITPEKEKAVMDSFESVAFAGLQPDQYDILWVRHTHADHHELHFVIPRTELHAGKAYNPCPPGWQKHFDVFRNLFNWREGWTRPDDPERMRAYKPAHTDLHQARMIRWGKATKEDTREDPRQLIHTYVTQRIEAGLVTNRTELVNALHEAGLETPRLGKNYLTVMDPDSGDRIRMKGAIYCEHWRLEQQTQRENRPGPAESGEDRARRVRDLSNELERVIAKRAGYNSHRYRSAAPALESENFWPAPGTGEQEYAVPQDHRPELFSDSHARPMPDAGHNLRRLGHDRIDGHPGQGVGNRAGTPEEQHRDTQGKDLGPRIVGRGERQIHPAAQRNDCQNRLDLSQSESSQTGVNHEHDRTRTPLAGRIGKAGPGTPDQTNPAGPGHPTTDSNHAPTRSRNPAAQRILQGLGAAIASLERYFGEREIVFRRLRMKRGRDRDDGFGL